MNDIKKILVEVVAVITLTLVMISGLGYILDPDYSQDGIDVIEAFHSLEKNSLDVIVYGSSHAWRNLDTRVMNNEYNIKAFNYGSNWQSINTTLLFLYDSLRTQKPKVALIETYYVNQVEENTDLNGQIYYCKAIPFFDKKAEYLFQCFKTNPVRYAIYFFPLLLFHDDWSNIDGENFKWSNYEYYVENFGYLPNSECNSQTMPNYQEFEQKELNQNSIDTLDKILDACQENDVIPIFYTCPYADEYNYINAMEEYCQKNACTYLNLFEDVEKIGLCEETDFADQGHLNDSGSGKIAAYLSDYLINNELIK